MWEMDCEEGWAPKNWCFWTMVLEKTLESPLDFKEIQPVHSEGDHPWDFFRRNDAKAETPVLWPPHAKSWLIGKRLWCWEGLGAGGEGDNRGWDGRWHHWLDGHESEWTPGVGHGRGALACCDSWGRTESDRTERLNWTELKLLLNSNSKPDVSYWTLCLLDPAKKPVHEIHFFGKSPGREFLKWGFWSTSMWVMFLISQNTYDFS